MNVRSIVAWIFAAVWVGFVLYGVMEYLNTEATGSGFTRGSNRISAFFQWQLYALGVAAGGFIVSRRLSDASKMVRLIGRLPLMISGAFFLGVVALFLVMLAMAKLGIGA